MTVVEIKPYLSHSQVSSLGKCGGRWWLEKAIKVPQRPGWAAVGGSATHTATEWWDEALLTEGNADTTPSYLQDLFLQAFDEQISEQEERTSLPPEEWRASGRASKAWPNKEDEAYWRSEGWKQVSSWASWRLNSDWEIAQLPAADGGLAWGIEVDLSFDIPNPGGEDIPVRAFVDRVFHRRGEYMAVDLKSGSYTPDSTDQLGRYAYGLKKVLGIRPKWGCYWMGRTGGTTIPVDLDPWTDRRVEYDFLSARRQQQAGIFPYHPSRMCGSCSVNRYCPEYGGDLAHTVPQPWEQSAPPRLLSVAPTVMMGEPTSHDEETVSQ